MTTDHIFTAVTIVLTTINAGIIFFNLKFNRRKDFEDKLFQMKLDSYSEMNKACYESVISLSANNSPFNEIYKIVDKKEWEKYFIEKISPEYHKYFEIQKLTYKNSLILPLKVVDKYHEFTSNCLSFITNSSHFDTELMVNSEFKLWGNYNILLNELRSDLKIEIIEGGLSQRISSKI